MARFLHTIQNDCCVNAAAILYCLYYSVFVLRHFNINMIAVIMLRPAMATIAFALVSADVGTVVLRVLVNVAVVLPVIVPEALLLVTV